MTTRFNRVLGLAACLAALAWTGAAAAAVIAYEWTEGGPGNGVNSIHQSVHGAGGPVLADDFIPAVSGRVVQVDWWGSAPLSVNNNDLWELTFHTDAGGVPAATLPSGGVAQHILNTPGVDPDGDGVFFYTTGWLPDDMQLNAGAFYWFSVANGTGAGWLWADAGGPGPTIGAEQFTGVVSVGVGPNGGPHFGPWNPVFMATGLKQDFAFRIWVATPEPAALAILAVGLLALGVVRRGRIA